MKTKILSILALLLTVTQGAWAQLGRVLATDGKYYKTVTAATNAGTTASGMIVYWGDGDTSDNTYNQGLVIALSDVVNNGQWGAKQDVTGITNNGNAASSMVDKNGIANTNALVSKWPTGTYSYAADHCASMSTACPSSSSNWFLPSQGQFVLMMNSYGAGYGTSTSYAYDNTTKGAVVTAINNALTNAGGTALSDGRYWTSTEFNGYFAGDWSASNSSFGYNDKTVGHYVRAMFAFSGATAAEYTVSYNANGGSGAPDAQTKDGGIDLTLSSTVPTRDGYTFAGWATSAEGAVEYSAGGSYTTDNDIVLYAQWTPTYTVTVKEGTEDASNWQGKAGEGEYQALPLEGVAANTAVNVKYNGTKRVKSVKAVKKAAAAPARTLAEATAEDIGKVVCAAGHLHEAKTAVPEGCTAVGILGKVTETGHGLILALQDATSQDWNTISGWASASYAGTTLKVLPDDAARGANLTSYITLGETTVSNWAVAQKSDYEAIFTNLGSTTGDSDGMTYDDNVNAYITGVGGTAIDGSYWSATEDVIYGDEEEACRFHDSNWGTFRKEYPDGVRPVLGF